MHGVYSPLRNNWSTFEHTFNSCVLCMGCMGIPKVDLQKRCRSVGKKMHVYAKVCVLVGCPQPSGFLHRYVVWFFYKRLLPNTHTHTQFIHASPSAKNTKLGWLCKPKKNICCSTLPQQFWLVLLIALNRKWFLCVDIIHEHR